MPWFSSSVYGQVPQCQRATQLYVKAARESNVKPSVVMRELEDLQWNHSFVEQLPGDPLTSKEPRQVHGALFTRVEPTPTNTTPRLVHASPECAKLLDLDPQEFERPDFASIFSGNAQLPGAKYYAHNYGGHQFGSWAGQLGDGRAISMGEILNAKGERWEVQLKGVGRTPYSRFADGRAVLRSSLREYVASEALHHLGVPTTRALCLATTGDLVERDMFYNGNRQFEPGAVACRVSPSFVRFGSFQLPVSRGQGEMHLVEKLFNYVLKHHYPHIKAATSSQSEACGLLLQELVERTARLVAAWQSFGFVHGVLNSDNMSILGLTIDYGPFGFLDKFEPWYTPNLTDYQMRRYSYQNQPEIGQANLVYLANSLASAGLVGVDEATAVIKTYSQTVMDQFTDRMKKKFGLNDYSSDIVTQFLDLMAEDGVDFHMGFRGLADVSVEEAQGLKEIPQSILPYISNELSDDRKLEWIRWFDSYRATLKQQGVISDTERADIQNAANPLYVPRQHLLQYAIDDAVEGDYEELDTLVRVLETPFEIQAGMEKYAQPPPLEMVKPGVTCLSCSS